MVISSGKFIIMIMIKTVRNFISVFYLSCVKINAFAFAGAFHLRSTSDLVDNILTWREKYKKLSLDQKYENMY